MHEPPRHVWFVHAAGIPHMPDMSQVSTPFPEHCVCEETQTPEQTPATHVCAVHAIGAPHMPVMSHDSTPLPEHWNVPGEHEPVHAPAAQTPMQGTAVVQLPF